MADDVTIAPDSRNKCEVLPKSNENDPRLDFYSENFDPVLALKVSGVCVPVTTARKYDNLAMYKAAVDREGKGEQNVSRKKNKDEATVEFQRRWLPHQLPVQKITKTRKSLLTRMDATIGPLAVLKKFILEKKRIKIYTRNEKGVRGYCVANLLAFDKHWNLMLEEVEEHWTRKKRKKVPALDQIELSKPPRVKIKPPRIKVTEHGTDETLENCSREVGQLMMRGEHVVLVTVAQNKIINVTE